jgi:valyl-tRNA synthetase
MLAQLGDLVAEATTAFDRYDYARALERTEAFFWRFCDHYLELVKNRAYGAAGEAAQVSAQVALQVALSTLLRLFAPFLPFVTEEVWSWWHDGSVHRAPWPDAAAILAMADEGDDLVDRAVLDVAADVLGQVRKAKTEAKRSLRWPVVRVEVRDTVDRLAALAQARADVAATGVIEGLELVELGAGEPATIDTELAPEEPAAD